MPRIRCHYVNCKFLDEGYCGAAAVELDPYDGCLTFQEGAPIVNEGVIEDEEDALEEEGWEEEFEEDDEDFWLDEDDL